MKEKHRHINEAERIALSVTPKLYNVGWREKDIGREVPVLIKNGRRKRADIVLYCSDFPVAIIEVKKSLDPQAIRNLRKYRKQTIEYAMRFFVKLAYLTDGRYIEKINLATNKSQVVQNFFSSKELCMSTFNFWEVRQSSSIKNI